MAELLTTTPLVLIILVLVIMVPAIFKFVKWILDLVKKHKANQDAAEARGRALEHEDQEEEERFERGEARIGELEEKEDKLEKLLINQQKQLDYLLDYNKNAIRAQVYKMWKKVIAHKPIDVQEYELLEESFELYQKTGGNGKTAARMAEIRKYMISVTAASVDSDE